MAATSVIGSIDNCSHQSPRQDFALRFNALYAAGGGPPLRLLASAARKRAHVVRGTAQPVPVSVSAQRISDWKAGRNVPSRFEALLPVLLVLVDAARRRGQVSRVELVNLRLWKQLWGQAHASRPRRTTLNVTCPFPGAAPYSRSDRAEFTGRDDAIGHLVRLVGNAAVGKGPERLVALTGAARVGKSSLLQAGLVPVLEARSWTVQTVVFGIDPVRPLAEALGRLESADPLDGGSRLLVIDQFERFFSARMDDDARKVLLTLIERLTAVSVVLISLRSSCLASCSDYPLLGDMAEHRGYLLEAMRSDDLRTVVTEPARRHGIKVEAGLEELLLAAIGRVRGDGARIRSEPGELLILSRALHAMWGQREGVRLTVSGYRKAGGVEGVVHTAATNMWDRFTSPERAIARRVLLALVSVRGDAADTRRRVPHRELARLAGSEPIGVTVLDTLVDEGMIIVGVDDAHLSHDLILTWPPLAEWVDRERPAMLVRLRTAADAAEWLAAQRHPSLLYRGMRLSTAMNYLDSSDPAVLDFLEASSTEESAIGSIETCRNESAEEGSVRTAKTMF
ncbi:ATP-binding protein [Nocardia sp. KC 131]|uniref:ATP-binding protein n=1 Tax=Nocardia arseniciresistens TaxID=3392119 RepID=UPI00398E97E0